jgi:acylpyruvate hydrolase
MHIAAIHTASGPRLARLQEGWLVPLRSPTQIDTATTLHCLLTADLESRARIRADEATFLPVVSEPRKIFCVGLNYRSHVDETGRDTPTYPVLFPKFASNLIGHRVPIALPPESKQVDYEAELAIIIGAPARRVERDSALDYVLGYTIANDVTMRDFQYKTRQWMQGKAWDRSTPLGPALVTPDAIDPSHLDISLRLNGTELQSSNTRNLIFDIGRLIEVTSQFTELLPGDVILTGTPGGVGFRRDPQVFLQAGDEVEVEIEGLGTLRNQVEDERGQEISRWPLSILSHRAAR